MKRKKLITLASFSIGAMIFATTAYADIVAKTGYVQLKDSIKLTAEKLTEEYKNYTLDATFRVQGDSKTILFSHINSRFDNDKRIDEEENINFDGTTRNSYNYSDAEMRINYVDSKETYYVTKYENGLKVNNLENPLKMERAKDVERILDAAIGNLKDYVILSENEDGSKDFEGGITQTQIPPLVNAISSFAFKEYYNNEIRRLQYNNSDNKSQQEDKDEIKISEDVFIKNVKGTANINSDGILESIFASGTLSARDEIGVVHEYSMEILAKVYDINSTVVEKPDMEGKEVVENVGYDYQIASVSKKFIGKYKNNIIMDKDGQFTKMGEGVLEITNIDENYVYGKHHEVIIDGNNFTPNEDFEFKAKIMHHNSAFILDENSPEEIDKENVYKYSLGNIHFDEYQASINFNYNKFYENEMNDGRRFNGNYERVFED